MRPDFLTNIYFTRLKSMVKLYAPVDCDAFFFNIPGIFHGIYHTHTHGCGGAVVTRCGSAVLGVRLRVRVRVRSK